MEMLTPFCRSASGRVSTVYRVRVRFDRNPLAIYRHELWLETTGS